MPNIYVETPVSVVSRSLLWSNSAPNNWVGRTALAERNGVWIAVYETGPSHNYHADNRVHIRFSIDQGVTWTAEDTFTDGTAISAFAPHSGNSLGDAWILLAPNGDLLVHIPESQLPSTVIGTYQYRSTNGGKTWSDEGLMWGSGDTIDHDGGVIVGSDIYITGRTQSAFDVVDANNLYKSSNNGASWSLVSVISDVDVDEGTGEAALAWMGGTEFLTILRGTDSNADSSYLRRSHDLGLTWDALENFTTIMNGLKIHRPRMRRIGSRVYVVGRDWIGDASTFLDNNVLFWTDDGGQTWSPPSVLNTSPVVDSGYVDLLRRGDRSFYLLGYEGNYDAASVYAYEVDIPSHTKELDGWVG